MRKFADFLKAVMRALRTTVKVPVVLADGAITWVWQSLFGSPARADDVEEIVEIPDAQAVLTRTAIEDEQRDRERAEKLDAIARSQLPYLVRRACGFIDMDGHLDERMFADNCDALWLVPWIRCLDESHRLTIRHMPDDTLLAHLDGRSERDCLPSYQSFDLEEAKLRIAEAAKAERTKDWSAIERPFDALDSAVADGEYDLDDHLPLWIDAQ